MRYVFVILDLYIVQSFLEMYLIPIVHFASLNSVMYIMSHIIYTKCTVYTVVYIIHKAYLKVSRCAVCCTTVPYIYQHTSNAALYTMNTYDIHCIQFTLYIHFNLASINDPIAML